MLARATDRHSDLSGERTYAARLVAERSELRLAGHCIERRTARAEGLLAVLLPEKGGIREARPYHALVARPHRGRVAALDVADGDEGRQQPALRILHREVALVVLESGGQHLARQGQEALLEAPGEYDRPFHQRGHFLEQRLRDQRTPLHVGRRRRDLRADVLAPRREVGQHVPALAQRALIGSGARDADRPRGVKTMATREMARGGVEERAGHHLPAVQHHHPVHRAHEQGVARAPVHAAWNRQRIQRGLDQPREQRHRALTGPGTQEEQERPLAFIQARQRLDARAATLGERERRTRRQACGIERRVHRRSAALEVLLGLLGGEALHPHGEPPWCCKANELTVRQARLVEARGEARDEGLLQGGERLGWQLLGADFKEEIAPLGLHATAPAAAASAGGTGFSSGKPSAARLSRYALATALASVRTRRM